MYAVKRALASGVDDHPRALARRRVRRVDVNLTDFPDERVRFRARARRRERRERWGRAMCLES